MRSVAPRLTSLLAQRGVTLELDLQASVPLGVHHLAEPIHAAILILAEYAVPPGPFRVRTLDRAGNDSELVVDGVRLPAEFPEGSPHGDLWAIALEFLGDFHRVRLVAGDDRAMILVPHGERAERLRRGAASRVRGPDSR